MTEPNGNVHRYAPQGMARTLLECQAPEVLMSGPAGTGKSRACLEKMHLMCLKNPGLAALMVRQTMVSMTNTGMKTYQQHVAKEAIEAGHVAWFGGSVKEPPAWRYTNGSFINVGGMDKPTKIMSSEYDLIFVQEAIELIPDAWESLTTRLRNGVTSFQQLMADTNPDAETHWLKQRCESGATIMLESRHRDNPTIVDPVTGEYTPKGAAYMSKLDALTGVRRSRLRDGLWVAAEGQIYEDWDRAIHLIDKPTFGKNTPVCRQGLPLTWPRYWVVDFGYTNPFVLQRWAEDSDGRLIMYAEQYRTQRLVEDHAADTLASVTWFAPRAKIPPGESIQDSIAAGRRVWTEPRPQVIVCDHDAEGRATLERHLGMSTTAAVKNVTDGIQAVQARLKVAGDGKPRVMFIRDAVIERDEALIEALKPTCTADEIPGYVWERSADGKPVKEAPLKVNDHGCDTTRYIVVWKDLGGQVRVRFLR